MQIMQTTSSTLIYDEMQCFACDAKHWMKHKQHVPCVRAADNNNAPLSIKKHLKKEVSR